MFPEEPQGEPRNPRAGGTGLVEKSMRFRALDPQGYVFGRWEGVEAGMNQVALVLL